MAWHTHGPKLDASDLKLMCTAYVLYLNYSCCSLQLEELQLRLSRLEPKPKAKKVEPDEHWKIGQCCTLKTLSQFGCLSQGNTC